MGAFLYKFLLVRWQVVKSQVVKITVFFWLRRRAVILRPIMIRQLKDSKDGRCLGFRG